MDNTTVKTIYEELDIEIVLFEADDVITASDPEDPFNGDIT